MDLKEIRENKNNSSGLLGSESIKKDIPQPKVELHVYPPLSYEISSKREGILVLKALINPGDTLSDLLVRLCNRDQKLWKRIFDIRNKRMRPAFGIVLNGNAVSPTSLAHTSLSDGDQIKFVIIYGGG